MSKCSCLCEDSLEKRIQQLVRTINVERSGRLLPVCGDMWFTGFIIRTPTRITLKVHCVQGKI